MLLSDLQKVGRAGFLLALILIASQLPAADNQSVMLRYSLEQLEAVTASAPLQVPAGPVTPDQPAPTPRRSDGEEALKQLLQLAGKNNAKSSRRFSKLVNRPVESRARR
jgi:hypothetical protein